MQPVPVDQQLVLGEVHVPVPHPLNLDRLTGARLKREAYLGSLLGGCKLVATLFEVRAIPHPATVR